MNPENREEVDALFELVVGACYEVSNTLGAGFLEKVYERALIKELALRGLRAEPQVPLQVAYKGDPVGDCFVDVLVEGILIVELKCCDNLSDQHLAQCLNYLKATGYPIAMHVNFQKPRGRLAKNRESILNCSTAAIRVHSRSYRPLTS